MGRFICRSPGFSSDPNPDAHPNPRPGAAGTSIAKDVFATFSRVLNAHVYAMKP